MATQPTAPSEKKPDNKPVKAYVRAVRGELRHLYTNVVFTTDPKKVEIDGFLQAQLDAGKLEIVTE